MKVKKYTQSHEEWLLISEEEIKLAKKAILGDDIIVIPTVFLAQQAAEKAFKAYLTSVGMPFRKTHDLVDLLERCMERDAEFEYLLDLALNLNPYVSRCRYPDDCFTIPDLESVERCIFEAQKILDFVKQKI